MNHSTSSISQYCNWCKAKGSHWTESCPSLAKLQCSVCGEYGHIDRFCEIHQLKREKQQAFEAKKQWQMPETNMIEFCEAFYRAKLVVAEPVDKYGYTESDRSNLGTQIYDIAQSIQGFPMKHATKLTWFILRKGKAQVLQFLNSPAIIEELFLAELENLEPSEDEAEDEDELEDEQDQDQEQNQDQDN